MNELSYAETAIDHWRAAWRERVIDIGREEADPWALPLIVRAEKLDPPTEPDVLTACASAVVQLLTASASAPGGDWHPPLARWMSGWIRKVVRRARGARWTQAHTLPGVTATVGSADVRALLPHPMADPPPEVAKLQVQGLELPAADPSGLRDQLGPVPDGETLLIALDPAVHLTTGKAGAQVGHAAQLGLLELEDAQVRRWARVGFPIRVLPEHPGLWRRIVSDDIPAARVHDAGFTEVAPGTLTCASTFGSLG